MSRRADAMRSASDALHARSETSTKNGACLADRGMVPRTRSEQFRALFVRNFGDTCKPAAPHRGLLLWGSTHTTHTQIAGPPLSPLATSLSLSLTGSQLLQRLSGRLLHGRRLAGREDRLLERLQRRQVVIDDDRAPAEGEGANSLGAQLQSLW